MAPRAPRALAALSVVVAMAVAACGGAATGTTTTTTAPVETTTTSTKPPETTTTSTTTTTTLVPSGPAMITSGDRSEAVAAFQWLLNCNGYGDLTIDGSYGPATLAAVQAAQAALGKAADGNADEEVFADLSRTCPESRTIDPSDPVTLIGNAAPGDPEVFTISLLFGSRLTLVLTPPTGVGIRVFSIDGTLVEPDTATTWPIETTKDYVIEVDAETDPVTFTLGVEVAENAIGKGDWILYTHGISYKGTKLAIGDAADGVITKIFDYLGHGARGGYGEFDTGWNYPGQEGFRGLFIEGIAFLFYGPNTDYPTRPETLGRVRYVGPSYDANGDERPTNYVSTDKGISVGNTLADLKSAYGTSVKAGSNSEEHYYKLTDSGGVLCFYFGADAPTDDSPITEMSTECRS
jgi:peptidoglycan hydrolase-like protein with peptidoglycan-binding domain